MFASTVTDEPEQYRDDIVAVLTSVLSESLRGYVVGFYPMSGVYQRLDRAIRLVFRAPFDAAQAAQAPVAPLLQQGLPAGSSGFLGDYRGKSHCYSGVTGQGPGHSGPLVQAR
jgi:hypothetical protein